MFLFESTYGGYLRTSEMGGVGSFVTFVKDSPYGSVWLAFDDPVEVLTAWELDEVLPLLAQLEASGKYAAGYVAYDASPAFDAALVSKRDPGMPLAEFFVYSSPPRWFKEYWGARGSGFYWEADIEEDPYRQKFERVHEHIGAGDTYQVNFSFRLRAEAGAAQGLIGVDPAPYATLMETSRHSIVSLSPELFFCLGGNAVTCRPMKGTRPREVGADERMVLELKSSEKELAENLMVVDMIRNDLGRIAEVGSVTTPRLFEVERYATVHQMTSTVTATVSEPISRVFEALFPCASIVGAPKVETMRIIEKLEESPRGLYTGCLGFIAPGRRARFSVAIRTVTDSKELGEASYGVGSGLVWDSEASSEFAECLLKAEVLHRAPTRWGLLETMLWEPDAGVLLLDEHLDRMEASAREVGVEFSRVDASAAVDRACESFGDEPMRMRLLGYPDGSFECTYSALGVVPTELTFAVADSAVFSSDPSLRIKSSNRALYREHLDRHVGCDEVLLWNELGEVTEFCNGNVVIREGDEWFTPPVECGLLPGVYRQFLLNSGQLKEKRIFKDEIGNKCEIFRINSVSRLVRMKVVSGLVNVGDTRASQL